MCADDGTALMMMWVMAAVVHYIAVGPMNLMALQYDHCPSMSLQLSRNDVTSCYCYVRLPLQTLFKLEIRYLGI